MTKTHPLILVTGATGYIGGRLIPSLLEAGYPVRVMTRGGRERLADRPWVDQVEIAEADVLQPDTLPAALNGVHSAYYLIHSMEGGGEFEQQDIDAAHNFAQAASQTGLKRIIYLGGLGNPDDNLSKHLRSRQETGQALRDGGDVPVTEFRAGMVVGAGSASFEILRYLTERLPVMIVPRWVNTEMQPIAIGDVLAYFLAALRQPKSAGEVIEIGGSDAVTYRQMMMLYAKARNLRRLMIPVPFFTPRLSSYWVHLITPVPATIAQPLIKGMHSKLVVRDRKAREIFPDIKPVDFKTALQREIAAR